MRIAFFLAAYTAHVLAQDLNINAIRSSYGADYASPATFTAVVISDSSPATAVSISAGVVVDTVGEDAQLIQYMAKRASTICAAQPTGISHVSIPDTDTAFLADPYYSTAADNATTPTGYSETFVNFQASNNALGYLGYSLLSTYDTISCAAQCDAILGCEAINICETSELCPPDFERDPSVEPDDSSCADPPSYTRIKCAYWGGSVTESNAVNYGQYQDSFHVVIAGSNGYVNNSIGTPAGYTAPAYLGNSIISAPAVDCAGNSPALGLYTWASGAFDTDLCATACTTYNSASPAQTCQFFNTYVLYADGASRGQYCQLYSQSFDSSYATNESSTINGVEYTYAYSFSSSNATDAGGPAIPCDVAAATSIIASASLQPYCSTLLGYIPSTATISATSYTTAVSTVVSTVIITQISTTTTGAQAKRDLPTPTALTTFPASVISSACSLEASPVATTATSTAATVVVTAETLSTTSFTTVTTVSQVTVAAPSPTFAIVSAYWADKEVTTAARSAFLQGSDLVVNTNIDTLLSDLGSDPYVNTKKSLVMLYTYGSEVRVWTSTDNSGSYTVTPGPVTSAANTVLANEPTAPSGANIQIVTSTWSTTQVTNTTTISSLYAAAESGSPVKFGNDFFGGDPLYGWHKTSVTWYYVGENLRALVGRESAYGYFNTTM